MKTKLACAIIAPLLLLSACEEEPATGTATDTSEIATGEVLGGTISDDMLPLDELTSTSPPAEQPATEPGSQGGADGDSAATDAETIEAEASADVPASQESTEE